MQDGSSQSLTPRAAKLRIFFYSGHNLNATKSFMSTNSTRGASMKKCFKRKKKTKRHGSFVV